MIFPSQIKAGLSFQSSPLPAVYTAPEWTVGAVLRGPQALNLTAVWDGERYGFVMGADVTATWAAGEYVYSVRAQSGVTVTELEAGTLKILPDVATMGAGVDVRDHIQKVIDNIEAVIEQRATRDQQRYTITVNGITREIWRVPIPELLKLRDQYRAELQRKMASKRGTLFSSVKVRF